MRNRSRFHRSIFRADPNGDPDINTTPLIDVMLVMLVMFIITIPPPTHSVDVMLPGDTGGIPVKEENRVTIDTVDVIRWNNEAVDLAQLGMLVKQAAERPEPAAILLEPEARARYLRVDEAIGAIRRNGGSKLAFPGIQNYASLI
ncbi:Biopolymer transport protein ExbD/TolR precursor [Sphingopyxis sp. LC81]|uniref:ExbD/TolR family protein n=1 Tax=Sphingopyxis sp. LC81 TaxID=1502850 RepID=UPI00050EDFE9|nr:biopolymer transporter ExbD [Sphingopyxis sp. LC81]KGB52286.1 Biopolymer transport protein ExbD/TolR precursor [Sphingopyxis sp. LC81]